MEKSEEEFMRMIGAKGTIEILEFLNENENAQYKDFQSIINTHTLNTRLRNFLDHDLVEHHLTKEVKRAEWYTITEKGKKVLHLLKTLIEVSKSTSNTE